MAVLAESKSGVMVPYRDSKLTRLLQVIDRGPYIKNIFLDLMSSYHYHIFISWHIFKRLNSRVILEV